MKRIDRAVLATLIYADIFDYPLTKAQAWRFLIENISTWSVFNTTLEALFKKGKIFKTGNYLTLSSRKKLVKLRQTREKIASSKLEYAQKIARLLGFLPTIQLIGVSGALAMHNAPQNDDVDFFIITTSETMWLTRFITTVLLDLFHVRRKPWAEKWQNKICLNMFMDGEKLRLSSSDHNLYTAHEVVQLLPLVNKNKTYERFLYENRWAKKYLPNAYIIPRVPLSSSQKDLLSKILVPVETVLRNLQLKFMKKRITTERLTKTAIRFHPNDISQWVLDEYEKRIFQLTRS